MINFFFRFNKENWVFINARKIKTWSLIKWMRCRCNTWMVSILSNCLHSRSVIVLMKNVSISYLGISWFLTISEKKLFRQFANSILSENSISFPIKLFFSLDFVFSHKKGFIVCQNFLLSVIFLHWNWQNIFFLSVTKKRKSFFS